MALKLHIDGGARGNPGPAGAGIVIYDEAERPIFEAGFFLDTQTNNSAEYKALILALEQVARLPQQPISIFSDSELLVRQITGQYQVKSPSLEKLFEHAQRLLLKVQSWSINHVRREKNKRADELANLAMDQGRDVIVTDSSSTGGAARKTASPRATPQPESRPAAAPSAAGAFPEPLAPQRISVRCTQSSSADACPAPLDAGRAWEIGGQLPAGMCIHAAHSLLTTILAIQGSDPQEISQLPTLTVRCLRHGCGAAFVLGPLRNQNGQHT